MPWRETRDPYRIWVSEVMLQQTQVATVIPYYERFVRRFPSVQALAASTENEVLALWEGLGYYSRARNLHRAARRIVDDHGGLFPTDHAQVLGLPGVGPYTAGAVLSIAHEQPLPAIDGNAERVLCRVFGIEGDARRGEARKTLRRLATEAVPARRPGDYNQALMELGSQVCLPDAPNCGSCPLATLCVAVRSNRQHVLPTPRQRPKLQRCHVAAAVLWRRGRVLVARRPPEGVWAGLWEFPWVEAESEWEGHEALVPFVREAFGLHAEGLAPMGRFSYGVMNTRYRAAVYETRQIRGRTRRAQHAEVAWRSPKELDGLTMPAPHRRWASRLAR
jgi:A/G-specific adenine glycosylase